MSHMQSFNDGEDNLESPPTTDADYKKWLEDKQNKQDLQDLFGDIGITNDYQSVAEQEDKMEDRKVEKTPEKSAVTIVETLVVADAGTSGRNLEPPFNYDTSGRIVNKSPPAPPISHSNPETPIAPFEMSFDAPFPMSRIRSEQITPSSRMLKSSSSSLEAAASNQHQNFHDLPTPVTIAHKLLDGTHVRANSFPESSTSLPASTACIQAGSEHNLRFETPSRQVRAPFRPSTLRNNVSAVGVGSRYQSRSSSPQVWAQDVQQQDPQVKLQRQEGWEHANQLPPGYLTPLHVNSQHMNMPSSCGDERLHGSVTHGCVNSHQQPSNLLLQQPQTQTLYTNYMYPTPNFNQRSYHTMKHEELSPEARHSRLKYSSLKDARKEKITSTHNAVHDPTFPMTDAHDCHYVDMLMAAMLDMSKAEDNDGMKRTWEAMMRDKEKVEKAAWEMVNLCKERHRRNGPFELSPRASRQFDTFGDRMKGVYEAVQTQKTMCKHLLRQPFIEEVIEDPIAAVARIKNNRKVNFGKKEAIDKGREALGERALGRGRKPIKTSYEDTDEEFDGDYDNVYSAQPGALMRGTKRRASPPRHRSQGIADDQSYRDGPAPKKARRGSRSIYQLNEHNQMIDTSLPKPREERPHIPQIIGQAPNLIPENSSRWLGMQGSPSLLLAHPLFHGTDFDGQQQAQAEQLARDRQFQAEQQAHAEQQAQAEHRRSTSRR